MCGGLSGVECEYRYSRQIKENEIPEKLSACTPDAPARMILLPKHPRSIGIHMYANILPFSCHTGVVTNVSCLVQREWSNLDNYRHSIQPYLWEE